MNYNESKGLVQLPVLYNAANAAENKNGVGEAIRQVKLRQVGYLNKFSKLKKWLQRFFSSFFLFFIFIQIVKAQDKKVDSLKLYDTYTSYKNNVIFHFPRNWSIEKINGKTSIDKVLYKSFLENDSSNYKVLLIYGKTSTDSIEAYDDFISLKLNENKFFKDSFKLHYDYRGQNNNGISYLHFKASGIVDTSIVNIYYTTFINQKDNKTYHIELQHNHNSYLKLKDFYDFIIDNFKFIKLLNKKKNISKNGKRLF